MKQIILSFLFSYITLLNAIEPANIKTAIVCSDSNTKKISLKINNNNFHLSQDAIQDNLGGYVDIPEDRYYLKTKSDLYYLDGVVEYNEEERSNQFTSFIEKSSSKYITIEEFYSLQNSKDLKFIQKIALEKDDGNFTTHIFNLYFDKKLPNLESKPCEEEVPKSKINFFAWTIFFLSLLLITLYFLKRKK